MLRHYYLYHLPSTLQDDSFEFGLRAVIQRYVDTYAKRKKERKKERKEERKILSKYINMRNITKDNNSKKGIERSTFILNNSWRNPRGVVVISILPSRADFYLIPSKRVIESKIYTHNRKIAPIYTLKAHNDTLAGKDQGYGTYGHKQQFPEHCQPWAHA